jgi:hypothetical protein
VVSRALRRDPLASGDRQNVVWIVRPSTSVLPALVVVVARGAGSAEATGGRDPDADADADALGGGVLGLNVLVRGTSAAGASVVAATGAVGAIGAV